MTQKLTLARIATALPRPTPSAEPLPFKNFMHSAYQKSREKKKVFDLESN